MEIIWGNRTLRRGDWKHLKFLGLFSFSHYTANGGDDNTGRWHHERVNLNDLYSTLHGDPRGVRLVELALWIPEVHEAHAFAQRGEGNMRAAQSSMASALSWAIDPAERERLTAAKASLTTDTEPANSQGVEFPNGCSVADPPPRPGQRGPKRDLQPGRKTSLHRR